MYTVAHVFHMYNVYSQLMTYESQDTVNICYSQCLVIYMNTGMSPDMQHSYCSIDIQCIHNNILI